MSDPMLPFKLMAPRTADTTAQTQKDTRTLASGEALQRLKDTGAMDLQRQKGRDQLRTTLAPLGIDPTANNYASNLDVLRQGLNALRMGQGVEAFSKGGVRIPKGQAFDANTGIMPSVVPGYMLPGEASSAAMPKVTTTTGDTFKRTVGPDKNQVGITGELTSKVEQKSTAKGDSVRNIANQHIAIVANALGLSPDQLSGRIVEREGKFFVEYGPKGKRQGRELTPEILRSLPQGIF
tara:strand:+ start:2938 stop:3648 length:711 start_codon:yes stop_codon:yes gene_type:complete